MKQANNGKEENSKHEEKAENQSVLDPVAVSKLNNTTSQ